MGAFMRKKYWAIWIALGLVIAQETSVSAALWSAGYYAGWSQESGTLLPSEIDYTALSLIIHFSVIPSGVDGIDYLTKSLTVANSAAAVAAAHNAGKKIIFTIGGANTQGAFEICTQPSNRATFINNLISFMQTRGYDGIDVDWEPLVAPADTVPYQNFVQELRTALNTIDTNLILTAAVSQSESIVGPVQNQFDQIFIMNYDMSGSWNTVSWHHSPIYNNAGISESGHLLRCTDQMVDRFVAAGVPVTKVGVGIAFYGYVWAGGTGTSTGGVTCAGQTWTSAPAITAVSYSTLMDTYAATASTLWDASAAAAYMSLDQTGSANDKFITFDNEVTVQAKVQYALDKNAGGMFIFQLGQGYRRSLPAGQKDLLLQTLKQALIVSPTQTATSTWTATFTATQSPTSTSTPTSAATQTQTPTSTDTPGPSPTQTPTGTPNAGETGTASVTAVVSWTITPTATETTLLNSPPSRTMTPSATPVVSVTASSSHPIVPGDFIAFPQPCDDHARIIYQAVKSYPVQISLYNMIGERVLHQVGEPSDCGAMLSVEIQTVRLPNGIYFLVLNTQDIPGPRKFVCRIAVKH
jgi:chitinase